MILLPVLEDCGMPNDTPPTWLRCSSHRARDKLLAVIGEDAVCHFRWDDRTGQGIYRVSDDLLAVCRAIKGVTKLRNTTDVRKCVSW